MPSIPAIVLPPFLKIYSLFIGKRRSLPPHRHFVNLILFQSVATFQTGLHHFHFITVFT